jgi:hypothetical protein
MKENLGASTLGELLLLISRNERIEKALSRLDAGHAPAVLADAVASLQRFLEEYGGSRGDVRGSAPARQEVKKPDVVSVQSTGPIVQRPALEFPRTANVPKSAAAPAEKPIPAKSDHPREASVTPARTPEAFTSTTSKPPERPAFDNRPTPARPAPIQAKPVERAAVPGAPKPVPLIQARAPEKAAAPDPPKPVPPIQPKAAEKATAPDPPRPVPSIQVKAPEKVAAPDPPRPVPPIQPKAAEKAAVPDPPTPVPPIQSRAPEKPAEVDLPPAATEHVLAAPRSREPHEFEDQQAYVHAVSLIPLRDSPSLTPFFIDELGLDQQARMFALDHAGMRFYLSDLNQDSSSVSKNGLLLLSKTDSIRLKGLHERILNRMRIHSTLLPAEFGTAVLGRGDLARRVEFRLHALLEFVLELGKTTTWRVTASVLDDIVQRQLGGEPVQQQRSTRQDSERGRHTSPAKRTDLKMLERLLTKEKKIAESILDMLVPSSESHRIEQLVNLGSGRSEDWKPILKAQFTLAKGQGRQFFQSVADVETAHHAIEPMIKVTGTTECFSLLM